MLWDEDPRFGEGLVRFLALCVGVTGAGALAGSMLWEDWGLFREWTYLMVLLAGGLILHAIMVFNGFHFFRSADHFLHHLAERWHHRHH